MASKIRRLKASGMKGRAGPLLQSTTRLLRPTLTFLKFNPDLASLLIRLNSGSRGCWAAMSSQLIPRSVIAFTTHVRSCRAASARAAADEESDGGVGDADVEGEEFEAQDEIIGVPDVAGGAVSTWLAVLRSPDEGVEMLPTSTSSSLGRERASATTFAFP